MFDYALYKGDRYLCGGSKKVLAKFLDVTISTITFYATPTYRKRAKTEYSNRYLVIRVRDDQ
jgi:hypothetical protein